MDKQWRLERLCFPFRIMIPVDPATEDGLEITKPKASPSVSIPIHFHKCKSTNNIIRIEYVWNHWNPRNGWFKKGLHTLGCQLHNQKIFSRTLPATWATTTLSAQSIFSKTLFHLSFWILPSLPLEPDLTHITFSWTMMRLMCSLFLAIYRHVNLFTSNGNMYQYLLLEREQPSN